MVGTRILLHKSGDKTVPGKQQREIISKKSIHVKLFLFAVFTAFETEIIPMSFEVIDY